MKAKDHSFESIAVGDQASIEHLVTEEDMRSFEALSGDQNPLHVDEAYARQTSLGTRVVYGMFLAALVSQLVGMHLPGKRALMLKESLEFKKPVHIGELIRITGVVNAKSDSTQILTLDITAEVRGTTVAVGSVSVRVLQEPT